LRMNSRTKTAIVGILGIGCMFVITPPLAPRPTANLFPVLPQRSLFAFHLSTTTKTRNFYVS
jgi:hypothetical protein